MKIKLKKFWSNARNEGHLFRAFAGTAVLRMVGMGFGFLVGIQLARGLGASGYGEYGFALAVISLASIPAEFGLPQLVVREVSSAHARGSWSEVAHVLRWAAKTAVMLSVFVMVVVVVSWTIFRGVDSSRISAALITGVALIAIVPLGNILGSGLRGLDRIVQGQLADVILRPAVFSLLLLAASVFFPKHFDPQMAVCMQVVAAVLALIVTALLLKGALPVKGVIGGQRASERAWLRSAWPMALTESMRALNANVAILVLGWVATLSAVGVFRVATSISLLLTMPISLVHIVAAPTFARYHSAGDKARLQAFLLLTTTGMVVSVALAMIPFVFFGEVLLETLFGSEFRGARSPLLILCSGTLVGSIFGPGATLLNMTGHERHVTRSMAMNLLIAVVLLVPLSITWGANGAAVAMSVAFVAWSVLMWLVARRILGVDSSLLGFFAAPGSQPNSVALK